jgi:hypothetical protein
MSSIYNVLTSKLQEIVTSLNNAGKTDLTFGLIRYGHYGVDGYPIDFNGSYITKDFNNVINMINTEFHSSGGIENALYATQVAIDTLQEYDIFRSKNIILVTNEMQMIIMSLYTIQLYKMYKQLDLKFILFMIVGIQKQY